MKKRINSGGWGILAAGAMIQLLTGFPSAWGVFRGPVMRDFQLDGGQAAFAANCIVAAYGAGCLAGGFLQDRWGPKTAGLWGSAFLTAGLAAVGFVPAGFPAGFYGAFSFPVGFGCAILYPAVMSCVQKWFSGRKGLATGIVGLGVGLSGLALTFAVNFAASRWGMRACFWLLAGVTGPLCFAGSWILKDPPVKVATQKQQGVKPRQMLKMKQFWLGFFSMGLATPALLLFGPVIPQLAEERGLDPVWAGWLVAMGSAGSAAGRLAMPPAGEKWGKENTDAFLFLMLAGFSAVFAFAKGWWIIPVYLILCFCYAGQAAVMPALCTQLFGIAHTGINYGFLALGASAGSLGFPLLAKALGLSAGRHWMAALAALAGFWCIHMMKKQK